MRAQCLAYVSRDVWTSKNKASCTSRTYWQVIKAWDEAMLDMQVSAVSNPNTCRVVPHTVHHVCGKHRGLQWLFCSTSAVVQTLVDFQNEMGSSETEHYGTNITSRNWGGIYGFLQYDWIVGCIFHKGEEHC